MSSMLKALIVRTSCLLIGVRSRQVPTDSAATECLVWVFGKRARSSALSFPEACFFMPLTRPKPSTLKPKPPHPNRAPSMDKPGALPALPWVWGLGSKLAGTHPHQQQSRRGLVDTSSSSCCFRCFLFLLLGFNCGRWLPVVVVLVPGW